MNSTIHTGIIGSALKSMVDQKTGKHVLQFVLVGTETVKDNQTRNEMHNIRVFDPGRFEQLLTQAREAQAPVVVYGKKVSNGDYKQCVIEAHTIGLP